jgi:hypothetical protein
MPPQPPAFGMSNQSAGGGRRGVFVGVGVVVAILLAAAALVIALVGRGKQADGTPPVASSTSATQSPTTDTAATDRALCEAIAPLMSETDKTSNDFFALGEQGSPARDAAIPEFVATTQNWVGRAQAVLDSHPDVQPFFGRSLQRYIDDLDLYIKNIAPGPKQTYDSAAWTDALVAYGGPLAICQDLGVTWSR